MWGGCLCRLVQRGGLVNLRGVSVKSFYGKCKQAIEDFRDFLDEKAYRTADRKPLSRVHRFCHFWLMVIKSFVRNRCPVHASALAYTTLLALVPMLAVAISVSSSVLKDEGRDRITKFIDGMVADFAPPNPADADNMGEADMANEAPAATTPETNTTAGGRTKLARTINDFIFHSQSTSALPISFPRVSCQCNRVC